MAVVVRPLPETWCTERLEPVWLDVIHDAGETLSSSGSVSREQLGQLSRADFTDLLRAG